MSVAFRAPVTSTQKLVLLALCDSANDLGECYPSVSTLTEKTSLSERSVQAAISELQAAGHLRRELRKGRATVYWMTPKAAPKPPQDVHPFGRNTPAAAAPPQQLHPAPVAPAPAPAAPLPPQDVHPTPAAPAPITINETSIEPLPKPKTAPPCVEVAVLVEAGFDETVAAEFIAHKARMKAPLTIRAWADHQRESAKAGWTAMDAAEKVMAKSWKGFEAAYVTNDRKPATSAPSKHAGFQKLNYREGIEADGSFR